MPLKPLRKNGLVSQLVQEFAPGVVSGSAGDVAEVDFLTLGSSSILNRERTLAVGEGLVFTDGGPNSTFTVDMGTPTSVSSSTTDSTTASSHTHAVIASSDPGATASLLETTGAGLLTLETLYSGGGAFQSDNFVSQLTGWQISYAGNADFRSIYADELRVRAFIADIEQALAGGQIISKSVALLSRDFALPFEGDIVSASAASDYVAVSGDHTAVIDDGQTFIISGSTGNDGSWVVSSTSYVAPNTRIFVTGDLPSGVGDGTTQFLRHIYVEDLPGFENTAAFVAGDWVRLRIIDRSGGGLVVADAWGTVSGYADQSGGEQRWTFRCRDEGGVAGETVYAGAIVLDYGASGDGYWEVTTLDNDSPYSQIVTWVTDPSNYPTNYTLHVRLGNLDGVTDGDFPTIGGWGLYSDNAYLAGELVAASGVVTINDDGIRVDDQSSATWSSLTGYQLGTIANPDKARIFLQDPASTTRTLFLEVESPNGSFTNYISIMTSNTDGAGLIQLGSQPVQTNDDFTVFGAISVQGTVDLATLGGDITCSGRVTIDGFTGVTPALQVGADSDQGIQLGDNFRIQKAVYHDAMLVMGNIRYDGSDSTDDRLNYRYIEAAGGNNNAGTLIHVKNNGGEAGTRWNFRTFPTSTGAGNTPASMNDAFEINSSEARAYADMRVDGDLSVGGIAPGEAPLHVHESSSGGTVLSAASLALERSATNYLHMLYNTSTGSEIGIFFGTQSSQTVAGIIYTDASDALHLRSGGNSNTMSLDANNDVGIGITTPASRLDVRTDESNYVAFFFNDGNASSRQGIQIRGGQDTNPTINYLLFTDGDGSTVGSVNGDGSGGVNYNQTSDRATKEDIAPISSALSKVMALEPISYRGVGAPRTRLKSVGLIAQDVQPVIPEVVADMEGGMLGINYTGLIPYLIGAIQELEARVRTLEA
jgi:hypothetical protein